MRVDLLGADRHRLRGDRHLPIIPAVRIALAAAAASITADLPAATAASNLSTLTAARTADGTAATRHLSITATPAIATAHTASRTALSTIQPTMAADLPASQTIRFQMGLLRAFSG